MAKREDSYETGPPRLCRVGAFASGAGGRWFDLDLAQTKYFKTGSYDFPSFALVVVVLALRLTDRCQDKWRRGTGNLPGKRRDITDTVLNASLNTYANTILEDCAITQTVPNLHRLRTM